MKRIIITRTTGILIAAIIPIFFPGFTVNAQYYSFDKTSSVAFSPLFYKGLDYAKGEFNANVLPFYLESNGESMVGRRIGTHLNFTRRKGERPSFQNLGVELATPLYLYRTTENPDLAHHFYLAPGAILLLRITEVKAQVQINMYLEPGYSIRIMEEIGVNIGIQVGKTRNVYNDFGWWSNYLAIRVAYFRIFGE